MGSASGIVFSGIAPHPPIMVPEVGGDAIAQVEGSIDAMAEFTRRLINSHAETVVLISPHAPLEAHSFVAYNRETLYGDFANFRAPSTSVNFPLDKELLKAITTVAGNDGYNVVSLEHYELDHGTAVPLYFLDRNGWTGRVVALGYSFLSNEDHVRFGECISKAANTVPQPIAFVASGDLSHRLKPDAPAGYDPGAHKFDDDVVAALRNNTPEQIADIDLGLRRLAGECGYRSMLVALGAISSLKKNCDVLHYEAPFGVGYLVAQLTNTKSNAENNGESTSAEVEPSAELPALARQAVETFVLTQKEPSLTEPSGVLAQRAACFVSIKTSSGDLRGCIGTVEPIKQNLAEELVANAINAATRDPRFPPVAAEELGNLRYSVDILGPSEPAEFEDLDPKLYGVIVEDESGYKRGLLLPDIEGVETARQQVDIAARKAGISSDETVKLSRFRVDRYREK